MALNILKTVIARYKTILENQKEWIKPNFKKPNDDRIGVMNLYRMGINYLEDSQVPDTVAIE